jgi:hypothetical protein
MGSTVTGGDQLAVKNRFIKGFKKINDPGFYGSLLIPRYRIIICFGELFVQITMARAMDIVSQPVLAEIGCNKVFIHRIVDQRNGHGQYPQQHDDRKIDGRNLPNEFIHCGTKIYGEYIECRKCREYTEFRDFRNVYIPYILYILYILYIFVCFPDRVN